MACNDLFGQIHGIGTRGLVEGDQGAGLSFMRVKAL
jgi:hypothetical protein